MITIPMRLRPIILLLGDSMTEQGFGWQGDAGWASLLASDYSRRADVLNRGFVGYNTRNMLSVLPNILDSTSSRQDILFATILLGANDAAPVDDPQYVPLDEFEGNLRQIVAEVRGDDAELPIVMITPPPVDTETWFEQRCKPFNDPADRFNEESGMYGARVKKVASQLDCCCVVDLFDILDGPTDDPLRFRSYLRDGVHLSDSGNRILHVKVMETIREEFPHLMPMTDGDGKYGTVGIPLEEALASELNVKDLN